MKKFFSLFFLGIIITACGPSQSSYQALLDENSQLKEECRKLQTEVENYKNAPDRLYVGADSCIHSKNIEALSAICRQLEKYHPSSAECKKAQTALQKLNSEQEATKKAEKAKRMSAVNKLKKKFDDVSGITWYSNPYFEHYNDSNHISLYIGVQEGYSPWLRLKMSYYGEDWIFFENAYLFYDGKTKEIFFNEYQDKKTDNYTTCWEWIDVSVDNSTLSFLKEMVNGKTLKMRLRGKYTKTKTLSTAEINGIKDVLLAYDVLKNGIEID